MVFSPITAYYIVQTHEISRFQEQQKSYMKQAQLSHVLNAQSDSIVVVSKPQLRNDLEKDVEEKKMTFQFCNSKSIELFGADLTNGHVDVLNTRIFSPCEQSHVASTREYSGMTVADRARLTLSDVFSIENKDDKMETECYIMQQNGEDNNDQLMLLVHRMDLHFNDQECQVLKFTDITLFEKLKKEKETTRLLKTLTACVSHDMIAPLNCVIELAEMLRTNITEDSLLQMVRIIITAARHVIC